MRENHGKLILILGLAGSGKSHLVQMLAYDFLIEENFAVSMTTELTNIAELASNLLWGRTCVVSERKYRSIHARNEFIEHLKGCLGASPMPKIKVICFENDLATANHNCRVRNNKAHDPDGQAHINQNNGDTLDYDIPADAIVVKVHRL